MSRQVSPNSRKKSRKKTRAKKTEILTLPAEGYVKEPAVRHFYGGVCHTTLWLWVKKKIIPAPKKFGYCNAWDVAELRASLKN